MKKLGIFLLVIIVLIVGGYFGAAAFVNAKGRDILLANIKSNLGEDAQVDTLSLKFPLTVKITNFKCGDLFVKEARVVLGGFNPFNSEVILDKVIVDKASLKVKIEKSGIIARPIFKKDFSKKNDSFNFPQGGFEVIPSVYAAQEAPQKVIPVKINKLYLTNSTVEVIDSTRDMSVTFTFKDIKAEVRDIVYPQLTKMDLNINAALEAKDITMNEAVSASGWVDYSSKDMNVDVLIKGIDYFSFVDYYPSFLEQERLGIKEASFDFKSNLNSQNNDMVIEVVSTGINYVMGEDNSKEKYLKTIVALLKGHKLRIKTKMDSPKIDFASVKDSFKGSAAEIGTKIIINEVIDKITNSAQDSQEGDNNGSNNANKATAISDIIDTFKGIFKKD